MSSDQAEAPSYHCFRCVNGCIHVVCGNVSLELPPADFLVLAEAIDSMHRELRLEMQDGVTNLAPDLIVM